MIVSFVLSAAVAAAPVQSTQAPIMTTPCDYGVVHSWTTATCSATLTNTGDQNLVVEKMTASHPGTEALNLPLKVPANGSGQLELSVEVGGRTGVRRAAATFSVSGADAPMHLSLGAEGFVYSVLDQVQPAVDFSVVDLESREPQSIKLTSSDIADFKVERVVAEPDFVDATLGADAHTLKLAVQPDAPWGLQHGQVELALNAPAEPEARVAVKADVHGRVIPSDNPYAIGVLRTDNENEIAIRLTSRDGEPFQLGDVEFERLQGDTRTEPCTPSTEGCKLLVYTIGESQPKGFVSGLMHVKVLPDNKTLTIGFEGLLLSPSTEIRSLNDESKAQQPAEGMESPAVDTVDIGAALSKAMQNNTPPPEPPGSGPVLRWEVGNQQTLYGYLIYRASAKDGPFQRVNHEIIRVMDPDSTNSYVWRDTSATKGETYWYYISTLANNGEKQQLSGAQKVVAH